MSTHTSTGVSGSVVSSVKLFVVMIEPDAKIAAPRPSIVSGVRLTLVCTAREASVAVLSATAVTTALAGTPDSTPAVQVSALLWSSK